MAASPTPPSSRRPDSPPQQGVAGKVLLLLIIGSLFILPFTGAGRRIKDGTIEVIRAAKTPRVEKGDPEVKETVVEKEKIVYRDPPPPPLPKSFVPAKDVVVADLFNGIQIQTDLQATEGDTASRERATKDSYVVKFSVNVRVPKPNNTLEQLAGLNPELPKSLPGLAAMMPTAQVSGFYHKLYELKQKEVETNITRLDRILSRHNFYDCETVLELEHPETKQKVLLMQGEMDVVADGSDGDRITDFDDYIFKSDHFQATTSYSWKKQTTQQNPLIPRYEAKIAEATKKLASATAAQKKSLQGDIEFYKKSISHLKTTSFLIAQEDPFVVIPLSVRPYAGQNEYAPQLGDYVIVAHGNKLLPAIVGDFGPRAKMGEASLRIAKEINPRATPYNRPESDLKVTYLFFPGSADKPFAPPDYAKWRAKCVELLGKIGGVGEGFTVHEWEDRIQKKKDELAAKAAAEAAAKAAAQSTEGNATPPPPSTPAESPPAPR